MGGVVVNIHVAGRDEPKTTDELEWLLVAATSGIVNFGHHQDAWFRRAGFGFDPFHGMGVLWW